MTTASVCASGDGVEGSATAWTRTAGSPGEWMIERMSELETEQKRRAKR